MKHIDEYRDPELAKRLIAAIQVEMENIQRPLRFMEVCGTHTMAIGRYGLRQVFPQNLELISGPGCPVCVTATSEVDRTVELAQRPGVILASFGDMLRVPGSNMSLNQAKAAGARVSLVYSAFDAVELAKAHPGDEVVFLGVGFETTSPTVAASLLMAQAGGVPNFSVLTTHKVLPPALEALLSSGELALDGFLMPGHVTAILGGRTYQPVVDRYGLACVVGGFEPGDILGAVLMLIQQCARNAPAVEIQYTRVASMEGNAKARETLAKVFEPADSLWRGLGMIPASGLKLRPEFQDFDAALKYGLPSSEELEAKDPPGCRCGEVLKGSIRPTDCALFDARCTPQSPVGPCMVSSEGTCAAFHKYERQP